ncbi:MAG: hypothetical protein E5W19_30985 [Mesorhizobium sp.]|nr:MAG: hypothetical protein E5W19_30985 [Mesorhizobium sp.]
MRKSKVEAPAVAPVEKPQTKKSQVLDMLNAGGISVVGIAEKLSISKQAAYSLIGDVKRGGVAITGVMKDGAMRYSVVPPKKSKEKALAFGKGASVSAGPSTPTAID